MTEKLRLISKETALVGLFLILLLLKDFAGVSVPSIVFTVAWILIILFCSTNVGGAFSIAAVICFASTISITIPSVVFILVALLRRQKLPKFNAMLIITFIIIFMELIRLIVVQGEVFKNYVNSMAVVLLVGTIITEMIEGNVDAKTCLKLFLLFFIFLSFDLYEY